MIEAVVELIRTCLTLLGSNPVRWLGEGFKGLAAAPSWTWRLRSTCRLAATCRSPDGGGTSGGRRDGGHVVEAR